MSFMPLYLKELGYGTLFISFVLSANGVAGMLSRYALGWIMKRTHLERILTIAGAVAAMCIGLTPIAGFHMAGIITIVLIMGTQ